MEQRLQKLMAQIGIGSRRACEQLIADGRVNVNGRVAELGMKVGATDKIALDGKLLKGQQVTAKQKSRVILYNKPAGQISSRSDPEGRPTVFANLPKLSIGRWIAVGRLDINTTGLLLFTLDGELANRLMHPRYQVSRKYAVRVLGDVNQAMLQRLMSGVKLQDGMARFNTVTAEGGTGANKWFHVSLMEGRNREVRRLWESQRVKVSRLIRIAYAGITLPTKLAQGDYIELSDVQSTKLYKQVGLDRKDDTG